MSIVNKAGIVLMRKRRALRLYRTANEISPCGPIAYRRPSRILTAEEGARLVGIIDGPPRETTEAMRQAHELAKRFETGE